jgi:hypothetical protein
VGDELRVDARLADAAGDQLRVLPAEVEHEDRALLGEELGPQRDDLRRADSWGRPS